MIERAHLNTDNGLEMECLWICFSSLIQKDLDLVKEQWNTRRIRASRHDTVAGIPDELYHLPERHGGVDGLALNISERQINFAKENFLQYEVKAICVRNTLALYCKILHFQSLKIGRK